MSVIGCPTDFEAIIPNFANIFAQLYSEKAIDFALHITQVCHVNCPKLVLHLLISLDWALFSFDTFKEVLFS